MRSYAVLPPSAVTLESACYYSPADLPDVAPPMAMLVDQETKLVEVASEIVSPNLLEDGDESDDDDEEEEFECVQPYADEDDDAERAAGHDKWSELERPAAMEREEVLHAREHDGSLRFELSLNSNGRSSVDLATLSLLTNLFCKQLPEMSSCYISKLVVDPTHVAISCVSNGIVVAGALYRPHTSVPVPVPPPQAKGNGKGKAKVTAAVPPSAADPSAMTEPFAELVFFAVDEKMQVGGKALG